MACDVEVPRTYPLSYAVYFDHQRRANPNFRRNLRREERRKARAEKEESIAQTQQRGKAIQRAVDDALEEGFPSGVNEKEQYFMDHVQQGETLAADQRKEEANIFPLNTASWTLDAALAFYKALKVYPSPEDLITIYDKTVDKRVLDVLAEMIAHDETLDLRQAPGINVSDLPHHSLD
ncbi:mitochondrial outer membrane translocase complex, subunit Tom20 domain-containing protein [Biscogniauxia mediterranea]|nr:mitochondrial outer membrane translocase complex, subunit Tom20 domain-containing protein [Biscogniauxia mediterranea]